VLDIKATNEGTVAGNARGENSVDLQTQRLQGDQVASGSYSTLIGGQNNKASGNLSVVFGGSGNNANAYGSVVAGGQKGTASFSGARVFPDASTTTITSRQSNEFTIQASALRLEDGNEAVGKVLTCNHADGSSNWAHPAKPVYTVATLPATPAQGDVAMVTDATATTFHSVVAGTGSNIVPVFYDGTNWRIG
jgi:hypothetical protein